MSVKVSGISACLAFICSWLMCNEAHAGPPFRTDDPEPVAYGHFEFYAFSERAKDAASGALPGAELNYGLIPNGQLTIGGEAAFNGAGEGTSRYGSGDTNLSFKYRKHLSRDRFSYW